MDVVVLIARVLFAAIFLTSGLAHLTATAPMTQYAEYKGVPAAKLSVIVSGVLMILGSVSIVLGIWGDLGALLLLVSILPIPFLMHTFWKAEGEDKMNEQTQFNKTISLVGGSLALFALFALVPELGLTVTEPLFNV